MLKLTEMSMLRDQATKQVVQPNAQAKAWKGVRQYYLATERHLVRNT